MGVLIEHMKSFVRAQRLGYVATVNPDGTPNLSPKGTTTVWDDGHLVFADIRSPQTVANLRTNAAVEINVVDPILRKGYCFKGIAPVLTEGSLFSEIMAFYRDQDLQVHDGQASRIHSIVLVKVQRALPLISPAYESAASEEEISARWEAYYRQIRQERSVTFRPSNPDGSFEKGRK